jgi:hypothetical protein
MLGGSDDLRGFVRTASATITRRYWARAPLAGVQPAGHGALPRCGKVVPVKRDLQPTNLHYSGGLGFRFRLRSAIVTRVDFAASSEGFRIICTFSDIFSPKF